MVTVAKLPEGLVEKLEFSRLMLANAQAQEESLIQAAMVSFSAALGNHPQMLNSDRNYFNFVASYVSEGLYAYIERAAAVQLGLFSLGGGQKTERVFEGFMREFEKVKAVVIPNEEAAELLTVERDRAWNFFLSLVAMTAVWCQRNPKNAGLFGIKRSFFGRWQLAV